MTVNWRNSINQSTGFQRIANITDYVVGVDNVEYRSAIDRYYKTVRDILDIVKTPDYLEYHPSVGPLLFIGIVSGTENYFRDVMSETIRICPISQAKSSAQSINLGSVIWHAGCNVERGSFENISLADSDMIRNTCRKYIDFDINKTGSTSSALDEFDKICELRHGIVHSSSIVAGKNAIRLGIKGSIHTVKIAIGYKQLQECAAICTFLVSSFNTELFNILMKRWAIDWPKLPSWIPANDNRTFDMIWNLFFSQIDNGNSTIPHVLSRLECRKNVNKEFNK